MPELSSEDSGLFQAIADPNRRTILEALAAGPRPVHELAALLPVSRSAVSQHLKQLRDVQLVTESRHGKFVYYQLRSGGLQQVASWIAALQAGSVSQPSQEMIDYDVAEEDRLIDEELARWESIWLGPNPLGSALVGWTRGVTQLLQIATLKLIRPFNLNMTDIAILGILHRIGPPHESTPTDLARTSVTSLPGLTRRLDHLEHRGLITREPSTEDKRSRVVRISAKGTQLLREYIEYQYTSGYGKALYLPPVELRMLARGMRRLLLRLQRVHNEGEAGAEPRRE